jgi:hydrogenase maturation protease
MTRILLIGIGNEMRRDDGVGVRLVERLHERHVHANCSYVTVHQLLPEMVTLLRGVDLAVFVDAAVDVLPGDMDCQKVQAQHEKRSRLVHVLSVASLLSLCHQYYGVSPRSLLVRVGGYDFGFGETLSQQLESRLPILVQQIETQITQEIESEPVR